MEQPQVIDVSEKPEYQQLLDGRPQTHGMRSGRVWLRPGQEIGQHSTGAHEEILVFLAGRGLALIGDDAPLEVAAGKVCYIPPQTRHNMRNNSDAPFVYIYCVAPITESPGDRP